MAFSKPSKQVLDIQNSIFIFCLCFYRNFKNYKEDSFKKFSLEGGGQKKISIDTWVNHSLKTFESKESS
jgi:hypothetical protein